MSIISARKPMKAFIIETDDPEDSVVRFATTNVAARREGSEEIGCDFNQVTCKRLPWADVYAGIGIPHSAFIANGWRYDCATCGDCVDSYTEAPAYGMDLVFCCEACKAEEVAQRDAHAKRVQEAIDTALEKWPGIANVKAYVGHDLATVIFAFPGGQDTVTWEVGDDHVGVSRRDVDAWNAWRVAEKDKESA